MKNLTLNTTVNDVDKPPLIHRMGIEAKELLVSITEHNIIYKELSKDKAKVENALLNANMIGQPAIRYYNDVFNTDKGDYYNIRQMTNAAKIFNPMFLAGKLDTEVVIMLHPLTDQLKFLVTLVSPKSLLIN